MSHPRIVFWLAALLFIGGGVYYMSDMPGERHTGTLPALTEAERVLSDRLRGHVTVLAGDIGERNVWRHAALEAASGYIEDRLRASGYRVAAQEYVAREKSVRNLEAELSGAGLSKQIIVIGAHYDSVRGSPGANDNATGIAAVLEIARLLSGQALARTVRFVAFTNEEAPFFYSQEMGSLRYARRAREQGEQIVAMLSLETIGYYSDAADSQHYPSRLYHLLYPDTGNFIGFVGNLSSRRLVRRCLAFFRRETAFPAEGVAAPGWMGGIHWSDHWSFWQEGYPALMVTDTALFRYPHYHAPDDTPDRIDYPRLARVVAGLARLTADLARSGP